MRYILLSMLSFFFLTVHAQKIDNFKMTQNGGELVFTYNLNSETKSNFFNINLFFSDDNKHWEKVEKAYGEIGDSIAPGTNKKMVVWLDHLSNIQPNLYFKIVASFENVDQKKDGNLTGPKGESYSWIKIGQTRWMTQNLGSSGKNNPCGTKFTNAEAKNACPDNWHLPSDEEWMELETYFDISSEKAKEHGLREINLENVKKSGFSLSECSYNASLYPNQQATAFWTRTRSSMLHLGYSNKYFARIIRLNENKISKELRDKQEKLSVRCVQNATFTDKISKQIEATITTQPTMGLVNHPFSGEEMEWIYRADNIWMKKDIMGSFQYTKIEGHCPAGWKLPTKEDWEALFKKMKPSIELNNEKEILSERFSSNGVWGMNFSNADYWMDIPYYTYNTYWILNNDKEVSKKTMPFPTNYRGMAQWTTKLTHEEAKIRCVLAEKKYLEKSKQLDRGTIIDKRDNKKYPWVKIDGTTWMAENLSYDMGEYSICRDNIKVDCELFGHMYSIKTDQNFCPDGWRLPTSAEWKYLLINKAANNLQILLPFGGTGFNLLLGGEILEDETGKGNIYTANYLFLDEDKHGYYYIDSKGKVELNNKAKKRNFYYVRCVKK
ncbi:MAG TPA: FISUMP domain-containing protein [Bacteroidales bacterium]|nr:FISUMP domain-containing protein [Bacteroidales bacterium]